MSVLAEAQNGAPNSCKNSQTNLLHSHIFTINPAKANDHGLFRSNRLDSFKPYIRHSKLSYLSDQPEDDHTIFLPTNPAFEAIWCGLCIVKIV